MASQPNMLELSLAGDARDCDIDQIHCATSVYTAVPEIEALLDRLEWPKKGNRLLDPGAGNGGFIVAALARLDLVVNDIVAATRKVKGYEFHPAAAAAARSAVRDHLLSRGWSADVAHSAAAQIIEQKDFLLTPVPVGVFDVIAANPPYFRVSNLPPESSYRLDFEAVLPKHTIQDLLYAYLHRSAEIIAPDGVIGLVTADRWLFNSGSAKLREKLGAHYSVLDIKRLDAASAFYRPKTRRKKGSPARVHPVSLVLTPGDRGRPLSAEPFIIDALPDVDGVPLEQLATIRLAPWLGPDGIFVIADPAGLPAERLVPVVDNENIDPHTSAIKSQTRWAIRTERDAPEESVVAHLDRQLNRMPARGQRTPRWLPPETFSGKLPLSEDAVLVPRIATRLRPVLLPAGTMPINHNLVVISGRPASEIVAMLNHPLVQEQAAALAPKLENSYASYTATLLRQLIIPHEAIQPPA